MLTRWVADQSHRRATTIADRSAERATTPGRRSSRRRVVSALAATVIVPSLVGCAPLDSVLSGLAPAGEAVDQRVPAPGVAAAEPAPAPVPVPETAPAPAPAPVAPAPVAPEPVASSPEVAGVQAAPAPVGVSDAVLVAGKAPRKAGSGGAVAGGAVTGEPVANPLAGDTLYGPNAGAARAAIERQGSNPEEAALLAEMASVPTSTWLGAWSGDVAATVRQRTAEARAAGAVPVFVAYNIPNRDCSGHSAGGAESPAAYAAWIQGIAAGIGSAEAVVIVEPDALALLCGDPSERYRSLDAAIDVLEANPATHTYLDAGHSNWVDARTMAERLRAAGIAEADGFALNVSNFETTGNNVAYGGELSALLGGARFVVDTSRNGNGPGNDWCNPSGRALGERTTTQTGHALVDAFVWVKTPGESDGACNGGPAAGQFWTEYALGLARG